MAELQKPPDHIIEFAIADSILSRCQSKRGAAIWKGDDLLGHGYNHKPGRFICDGSDECKSNCSQDAVHAEQAALLNCSCNVRGASMLHVKTVGGELVASAGPSCLQCSKLIIEAGIADMWLFLGSGWKRYEAAEFHWRSGAYIPRSFTKSDLVAMVKGRS